MAELAFFSTVAPKMTAVKAETNHAVATLLLADCNIDFKDPSAIAPNYNPTRTGVSASGSYNKGKYVAGYRTGTATAMTELVPATDNTDAPKWYPLFHASGWQDFEDTTVEVGNKSLSWGHEAGANCSTVTFANWNYETCGKTPKGKKYGLRGACNNLSIAGEAGQTIRVSHNFMGVLQDPADVASGAPFVLTGHDTAKPTVMMGGSFEIKDALGTTLATRRIRSFNFQMQTVQEPMVDPRSDFPEGVSYCYNADFDPMLELVIQETLEADQSIHDAIIDGDVWQSVTLNFGRFKLLFEDCQPYNQQDSAIDSMLGVNVSLAVVKAKLIQKA